MTGMKRLVWAGVAALVAGGAAAQSPFVSLRESVVHGGRQFRGMVALTVAGAPVEKRYVFRVPSKWNGGLVIGAHGGSGGNNFDRSGQVIGTDETALDDVIGRFAMANGFAYASVDRDGAVSARDGAALTYQFTDLVVPEVAKRGAGQVRRKYIVGLSMGGGIARAIAEDDRKAFDAALIIAGAGGDVVTRLDRQTRMAALWPLIDPRAHFGLPLTDPKFASYAEAVGTPIAARRLWPYTGASAVAAAKRPPAAAENSSARPTIPVIEVVGTWDDLVIRELRAYRDRVEPKDRHRLYEVEGVWHMSGDDDGVMSFQYIAESRMKLDKDVADAIGEGPSYLPTVRDAFGHLVRWVERGVAPPPSQTVKPEELLRGQTP